MKKMIITIIILSVIFVGMLINKTGILSSKITVDEVTEIEKYITKLYMWSEVTEEALPSFEDINEVNELWLWEVVKKDLEEYELTYNQIEEKANEIFGDKLTKKFPKEGTEYIIYDQEDDKYYSVGMGLDSENDTFLLNKIEKTKDEYKVEIVEYIESHEEQPQEDEENETYMVKIKNLSGEVIAELKNTEAETKVKELVKENFEKFSTKLITIKKIDEKLYVESVN